MKQKKYFNLNLQISRWTLIISLSVMCLFGAGYWYSYTGTGDEAEANPVKVEKLQKQIDRQQEKGNDKKVKKLEKKLKKYKSKAQTTIEKEGFIIRNADTPHEYKVEKQRKGKKKKAEREPDLSKSIIKGEILEGKMIRYTVKLKNKGNTKATDVDILVEIDPRFSEPENLKFKQCGKKARHEIEEGNLGISNLRVKKDKNCVITYDVSTADNGQLTSHLFISPATEGGEEIGPIEADPIRFSEPEEETAEIVESIEPEVSGDGGGDQEIQEEGQIAELEGGQVEEGQEEDSPEDEDQDEDVEEITEEVEEPELPEGEIEEETTPEESEE